MSAAIRVQFIHGLDGSPQGTKSRALSAEFETLTPAMDTGDFEACALLQAACLAEFKPHVLVGSSFGGAVALALLQRGLWQGPTLLLAQAGLRYGLPARLPPGVRIWIVHGTNDDIIDPRDSRTLAAGADPQHVLLLETQDDHFLTRSVARGDLVAWVKALAAAQD